jgi:hypothetical protein
MKIQVDVDLKVPRWVRNTALVLAPVAVVLATTAIVRAGVPNVFATGDTLSAQKMNDNFTALDGRVTILEAIPGIPPGTISAFGGTVAPAGWLICDGAAVDRLVQKNLFMAIGINFGGGDGVATFNLPDLRGRFVRGQDHGTARDPDAATRTAINPGGTIGDNVGSLEGGQLAPGGSRFIAPCDYTTGSTGGSETRPLNVNVNYIIKL